MSDERFEFAKTLAERAGAFAREHFDRFESLTIESKGHQDMVSEADRDTETLVRDAIMAAYPQDGILGEEHGRVEGSSGYLWIIDPIDGTANFVTGIPQWCVIIACLKDNEKHFGVIYDPVSGEMFTALKGEGTKVNGRPAQISQSAGLHEGSVGLGHSSKSDKDKTLKVTDLILSSGGMFFRNASGGLMLAYTATGRLAGYIEEEMNVWDCVAGLLMIEEAGGLVQPFDMERALTDRCRVVAGGPQVYKALQEISEEAFG
ncbi:inositol monophosphatase family protein [Pseudovibrio sp. SPO723]|uniref:inositol monophosphatase family protein n=1 Tax=Nesiotobacter zosterae TaxID=392721 RepID=UPI0029C198C1|nr:inositol monophosphatase family protein [Pseudovibrio sp. SPO723]MDX5593755.1 inositol monophosphatase family protein [Pseudovibrio sp. SPO723]